MSSPLTLSSVGEGETRAIAARLAGTLLPGDVVALYGGLGAGKTAFVRGLAGGLGLDENQVSSPTFALVNEYRDPSSPLLLCHFDMYRVTDEDALYHTGFYDYLESGWILAVEWSENVPYALPESAVRVTLAQGEGETHRTITIADGRANQRGPA